MSFVWGDFLDLGLALLRTPDEPGPKEAALRTAISRAYYAAFGTARDTAITLDHFVPRKTGEDHERIVAHFSFADDPLRRRIGADLYRLRHRRNRADYDRNLTIDLMTEARSSVDIARNILNALSTLETGNTDD